MSVHLQFSYRMPIDHHRLLDHVQTYFKKYILEHIAIGTLDNYTQVYLELTKRFHIQGKYPLKKVFENFIPELEKKYKKLSQIQRFIYIKRLAKSDNSLLQARH